MNHPAPNTLRFSRLAMLSIIAAWVLFLGCQAKRPAISPDTGVAAEGSATGATETQRHSVEKTDLAPETGNGSAAKTMAQTEKTGGDWIFDKASIENELVQVLEDWGETAFEVDDTLTRHVAYYFKYYVIADSSRTNRAIARSEKHLPYIVGVFRQYKLPKEIAFALPFVESSFVQDARSNAGAVGMFQFMKATAQDYGLKVTRAVDERKDVQKSAVACAKYLRNNRNVFASTVLSLGSYHHGTGKVSQVLLAAAEADERKFGPIFRNPKLGRYSKEYIPQCLSAVLIYRFLEKHGISRVPVLENENKTLDRTVQVASLVKSYPDLYVLNPDLIGARETYQYASTRGYLLLTKARAADLRFASKSAVEPAGEQGGLFSSAYAATLPVVPEPANEPEKTPPEAKKTAAKPYPWPENPVVPSKGNVKVSGKPKYVRYVFQEGNRISVLADIFGTSLEAVDKTPENRYLKKRQPKAGDIVRFDGLSPTTQKIGGGGYVCGKQMDLKTKRGESLRQLCERFKAIVSKNCRDIKYALGDDVTPELVRYWNMDSLDPATPDSPLPGGVPVTVFSDYRWTKGPAKSETASTPPATMSASAAAPERRTGPLLLTVVLQDENLRQGKGLGAIAEVFRVNISDILKWNPSMSKYRDNESALIGKKTKIKIRNCPKTTQKFGNPGVVCGRGKDGSDTRLTILPGQSVGDVAETAKRTLQKCDGRGEGASPENILFWNADALKEAGIRKVSDLAKKQAKLTVYADYY